MPIMPTSGVSKNLLLTMIPLKVCGRATSANKIQYNTRLPDDEALIDCVNDAVGLSNVYLRSTAALIKSCTCVRLTQR